MGEEAVEAHRGGQNGAGGLGVVVFVKHMCDASTHRLNVRNTRTVYFRNKSALVGLVYVPIVAIKCGREGSKHARIPFRPPKLHAINDDAHAVIGERIACESTPTPVTIHRHRPQCLCDVAFDLIRQREAGAQAAIKS